MQTHNQQSAIEDAPREVEPHGLTAVAPHHTLRRAEPSEAHPPSPRLRRVPTSHSSTGLPPWLSAKEGKTHFDQSLAHRWFHIHTL